MTRVTVPDAMTRFQCNLKGCCCKGWSIRFDPDDLVNLLGYLSDEEQDIEMETWDFWVDEQGNVIKWAFGREGDDACEYLADDGKCALHIVKGADALPHLCRTFPAFAFTLGEGREVHYDAICPEVLNQIDEGDGPLSLVELDAPEGSDLDARSRRPIALPPVQIGEQSIPFEELARIRATILERLADERRPALEHLARINYALARLADGEPVETFAISETDMIEPFQMYFETCVQLHQEQLLARMLHEYRRFIFAVPLEGVDWDTLPAALSYDPDWRHRVDPDDVRLQPLIRRYLAHRFFSPFDRSPAANRLGFTYGTINHSLATAFRFAAGLSRWLDRPVDRALLKVAMGASEYIYRVLRIPPDSMPWFGMANERLEVDPLKV